MKQLLLIYIISVHYVCFGRAHTCSQGPHNLTRFGPYCEYLCHCRGQQCDINTGECPDNMDCDPGWMGSGCQYVNIAYNVLVQNHYWDNRSNIIDGKKSTCGNSTSVNEESVYLLLDFGREVKITEVHFVFAKTVSSFNVSVIGVSDTKLCSSVTYIEVQEEDILMCGRPLYERRIQITLQGPNTISALCEIQVPAGRNLAYGKPVLQSTVLGNFYPNRSVDGDATTGSYELVAGTCTHTLASEAPWWVLDLETSVIIQWFRIYNRQNNETGVTVNLQDRLKDFRIFLSRDNASFTEVYQDQSNHTSLVTEPVLKSDVIARFVKIDLNGTNRILTLCEVQVFGECEHLFYGNCSTPCGHCAKGRQCDRISGYCDVGGCADGWQTVKCEKACNDTYYGNCSAMCGYCRHSAICDKITGSCPLGLCSDGWHGERCDIECSGIYYGQNCASKCGHCLNGTCDRFTGNCLKDDGCEPGWQGSRCDIACKDAYYGNCTTLCGNCRDSAICNKVDGSCPLSLCSEGWDGETCDTMCNSTHYGQNCVHECGRCLNGSCDPIKGNCFETSGCQPGWHGSRCDLAISGIQKPGNRGVIAGAAGAVVGVIIIVVILIVVVKYRRNKNTSKKETNTNQLESIYDYINSATGSADTPAQPTGETNLHKSNTYYNIEELRADISKSMDKRNWNSLNTESDNTYYEKLGDRSIAEESSYSTIEHSHVDNHGRNASENTNDYDEQQTSLDIELKIVEEKKGDLLQRKEKFLRHKFKNISRK